MPEITVAIATDPHYIAPDLTDHGPGYQALIRHSDGKVMDYIEELTDAFLEEIMRAAPAALILSGDLSYNGARRSHEALAAKLRAVEVAGVSVLVIPGNHDLNNKNAARFSGGGSAAVESVTAAEFAEIYAGFGFRDALARDDFSLSYMYEISPALRVLMLDVNTAEAPNTVRAETLAWTEAQLRDAAQTGAKVIAVSHQNALRHNSVFVSGYRIENSGELLALYRRYGVPAGFSGHLHCQHIAGEDGFYEIATSSLAVSPNQYGLITVGGDGLRYETAGTDVSGWANKKGSENPELLDFSAYSRRFFLDGAYTQGMAAAGDEPDAPAMAAFLAELNAAYFAGRLDTAALDSPLIGRWRDVGGFQAVYIESVLADGPADYTGFTLED